MTPTRTPLAVIGLGGIGGLLAAPPARSASAPSARSRDPVERPALRHGARRRPPARRRRAARAACCAPRYRGEGLRPRPALERIAPGMLDGAVVLPLLNGLEHVDAVRVRLSRVCNTLLQRLLWWRRARSAASRPPRRSPVWSPGRAGGWEDHRGLAGSPMRRSCLPRARAAQGRARRRGRRARGPLGQGRPARRARCGDRRERRDRRRAAGRCGLAWAIAGRPPRGGRRRCRRRRRARSRRAMGDHRGHAARLTTSAARDAAAGRPTELDAITARSCARGRVTAFRRLCSTSSSQMRRRWPRGDVDPRRGGCAASGRRIDRAGFRFHAVGHSHRRRGCSGICDRRRRARAAPLRVVRVRLRPRDLLAVRLAAGAPPRAVQHDRPADAARRPRRAGDRAARAARHDRHGRARDPASCRPSRWRRRPRFSTFSRAQTARAVGRPLYLRCSGAPRPSSCIPRSTTSIPNASCRCCSSEGASRSPGADGVVRGDPSWWRAQ